MDQEQRLEFLIEEFKAESDNYRELQVSGGISEKRRVLRSLMNVRMPKAISSDVLRVQDEYLTERAREKGIVELSGIKTVREAYGSNAPFADIISIWQGDITRLAADAIVNAANSQMLGCFIPMHNCIDNCIHSYAGIQLRSECSHQMQLLRGRFGQNYEQPTSVPMLTDAYNLPAKKVIHIVGPIINNVLTKKLEKLLADCYTNTLTMCAENALRSVAFCCISTGVFRFPADRASQIAVDTVTEWLGRNSGKMERVIFNVFGDRDRELYEAIFR